MEGLWKLLPLLLNRPLLLLEIQGDLLFWVELDSELVLGVLDLVLAMEEVMEVGLELDMELELA